MTFGFKQSQTLLSPKTSQHLDYTIDLHANILTSPSRPR